MLPSLLVGCAALCFEAIRIYISSYMNCLASLSLSVSTWCSQKTFDKSEARAVSSEITTAAEDSATKGDERARTHRSFFDKSARVYTIPYVCIYMVPQLVSGSLCVQRVTRASMSIFSYGFLGIPFFRGAIYLYSPSRAVLNSF